ncbi:MAG: hypothetical protein RLP16_05430 [Alphaproteobacteria bacterium]
MPEDQIAEEEYELKLTGNGVSLEKKIGQRAAMQIIAAAMGQAVPDLVEKPLDAEASVQPDMTLSIREFLDQVSASKKRDQIVAIGHYLCNTLAQRDFSRDEVKQRFSDAKEPMPANFPRDFGAAAKAGMIAEAHQKSGRYYVTKTGMQAVKNGFGKPK